ncbi:hypothetical protein ACFT2C_12125 [Promicromonospora sp. NPDC057138]|uniref:hypothetical protein n=1 Tax=Promicromonospora sp. NPDC057138 TaxID=3346031 RepID=UPI003639FE72
MSAGGMRGPDGAYTSRRMVLRGWGSADEVMTFAAEGGFELIKDEADDAADGIVREVIWQVTAGIVLQYAVDGRAGCSVFVLAGAPADDVQGIAESIEQGLHPWTLKELLAAVDKAKGAEETCAAVLRAGIGAPFGFDRRFYKRLRKAVRSDDAAVRRAGVWATSYSRWAELRPDLEAVASADPDPELRRDAEVILDHYSR